MNRKRSYAPDLGNLLKVASVSSVVLLVGIAFGVVAAIFPAGTTLKLGLLLAAALVFILALLSKGMATQPNWAIQQLLLITIFVDSLWPVYLAYKGLPGPSLNPERLAYWSLSGLWIFWFVASRERRYRTFEPMAEMKLPLALLVIYLGWSALSALLSGSMIFGLYFQIKLFAGPILLLLAIVGGTRSKEDIERILQVLLLAALIAALIGVVEGLRKANLFQQYLAFLMPSGTAEADEWAANLAKGPPVGSSYRSAGTYSHPLSFAEFLVMTLPVAIYFCLFGSRRFWKAIGLLSLPLIGLALFYTHTRSGLIAASVSTLAMGCLLSIRAIRRRNNFAGALAGGYTLILLIAVAVLLAGTFSLMIEGRTRLESSSTMARILMFERGADLVMESPLVGYGPGKAAQTIGYLPGIKILTIDSYYLSVVLESGIPGLLLLAGPLFFMMAKGMLKSLHSHGQLSVQLLTISTSLFGFLIFRSTLSLLENFWLAFVFLGLLIVGLHLKASDMDAALPLVPRPL